MPTIPSTPRRALRTTDAAQYLGISASLLRKMRLRAPDDPSDQGPVPIKLSPALIVYDIAELDRWLDAHRAAAPEGCAA
ncbi:MAG: helix-turn-helix transcriptional regulator [Steroidobacteraceae bacterium]